jgi:hypothetical protein
LGFVGLFFVASWLRRGEEENELKLDREMGLTLPWPPETVMVVTLLLDWVHGSFFINLH